MRRQVSIVFACWVLIVDAVPASGAWPNSPATNLPVCTASFGQTTPAVASDGLGGALVAWCDARSGAGQDIYAQHVLASGSVDPLWPTDGRAVCTAAGNQTAPKVVSDGAGGAIVVWSDARVGSNPDVYAQHVLAMGDVDSSWPVDGRAVCTASNSQIAPQLIPDGFGGAIIAWQDSRPGSSYDIYAQHLQADGTIDVAWPGDGRAMCSAGNNQEVPVIVSDGAGGAIVSWQDYRSGSGDIFAQRVLASGVQDPAWPADGRALCTATGNQVSPMIVSDGDGSATVAWLDIRSSSSWHIYAQRVLGSGETDPGWPSDGLAVCATGTSAYYPAICTDGAGGAIVTWLDVRAPSYDIYAQRVLATGATHPAWPVNGRAVCAAPEGQYYPTIAPDGVSGAIVSWYDNRSGYIDIYAQHVLALGAVDPGWATDGCAVSVAPNSQTNPQVIADGSGGAIIVWTDFRSSAEDIYAQRVDAAGKFGDPRPHIAGIRDVPNDQGGQVKLSWSGTFLEAAQGYSVDRYWILRSVPEAAGNVAQIDDRHLALTPADGSDPERGVRFRASVGATDYYWEFLASQPAFHQDGYSYVAGTTGDSMPESNPRTAFMIMARNADGTQWWFSDPDSGFSVDNLAPPTPAPFVAQYQGTAVELHWLPSASADFREFRLYRGPTTTFVPAPEYLVLATTDTGYVDHPPLGAGDVYKLAALDLHGNSSRYAIVTPTSPVSTLASLVSANWTGGGAEMVWFGGGLAAAEVAVHRSEDGAGWCAVATAVGDGQGYVRFTDASVLPGHRYGYRLAFLDAGVERFAGETFITIPAGQLAIQCVAPNPVIGSRLGLRALLADTGPARVRIIDLAGRVVRDQEIPASLTGQFDVPLAGGAPLRPGVYVVELRQGGARATTRFTYLR